jgi:hypothetical protein
MPKLDISAVSDREAAQHRIRQLTVMRLNEGDKRITFIPKDKQGNPLTDDRGKPITLSYMLSEAVAHIQAFIEGKKDLIGEYEIKFTKKVLAYEKGSRHT